MENFTGIEWLSGGMPVEGLIGGFLIGLAAWGLLLVNGQIAGVSGIFGGVFAPRDTEDFAWRALFLIGLIAGAAIYRAVFSGSFITFAAGSSWPLLIAGGLLVGFGTRLGGGCTSGHGVCGVARLSKRSIAATATFIAVAVVTVFIARHIAGG